MNNFIGTWKMDELFVTCEITADAFKTIADIDRDGMDDEVTGTYTLSEDKKSATASFVLAQGAEPTTVDIALLEGETDVATMDLTAFQLGERTFVKYREAEVDLAGTWTDGKYNITVDANGFTVAPVSAPTYVVSEGTVAKEGNTFTLTDSDTSDDIATGLVSTNGKAYVNYLDGATSDRVSAPFTKSAQ